jgi:hypothetical protein
MAEKEKLTTLEELEMLRVMDIPPKRGTPAYDAMKAAIRDAKEKEDLRQMTKAYKDAPKMKKGGAVKSKPKSSVSKRADGVAKKGKTRGKMV